MAECAENHHSALAKILGEGYAICDGNTDILGRQVSYRAQFEGLRLLTVSISLPAIGELPVLARQLTNEIAGQRGAPSKNLTEQFDYTLKPQTIQDAIVAEWLLPRSQTMRLLACASPSPLCRSNRMILVLEGAPSNIKPSQKREF